LSSNRKEGEETSSYLDEQEPQQWQQAAKLEAGEKRESEVLPCSQQATILHLVVTSCCMFLFC
jgi:hypothetical protein